MCPWNKRSSLAEDLGIQLEADADSAPQNSITVAAGVAAGASSPSNETVSASSSPPAVTTSKPADETATGDSKDDGGDREMNHTMPPVSTRPANRGYYHDYEFSDLDEIYVRQLNEDICAYKYDLEYCQAQLEDADLNPQETRTLQLRTLDLGHQIRHCKHRIEEIKAQARLRSPHGAAAMWAYQGNGASSSGKQQARGFGVATLPVRRPVATPTLATGKRPTDEGSETGAKRVKMASPDLDATGANGLDEGGVNTSLQRLGFWKCRLCSSAKYLLAGAGRSPAAPCKWPLKDISKMITHFTEMHAEHTPAERCAELGAALLQNRGPFEYWLRRTRAQNISDESVIDNCIAALLNGEMPTLLRRHSRAAAGMPTS
ncbi:hypothetical protein C8A03DRAFT_46516 [Achaetomium macrosporum]|uniref:Uncharacterized protein n=1 Tax=Achaetomium macrosporum TaxID=79813 RepID=A0AAN7C4P4_9PEZI|nr:hypothetical protein C8A03DRAFT_46516 [Achaetomium macrosporum]